MWDVTRSNALGPSGAKFFDSTIGSEKAVLLDAMEASYAYKCSSLLLNTKGCGIDRLLKIVQQMFE